MSVLAEAMVELGIDSTTFVAELTEALEEAAAKASEALGEALDEAFEAIAQEAVELFSEVLNAAMEGAGETAAGVLAESLINALDGEMDAAGYAVGDALAVSLTGSAAEAGTEAGEACAETMTAAMTTGGAEAGAAGAASLEESSGAFSAVGDKLSGLLTKGLTVAKLGFVGLGAAAIDSGLKSSAAMQQATASFQILYNEGIGPATQQLQALQAFANTTPFQFSQLEPDAAQLASVGVSAQGAIQVLTVFGDAAQATGRGAAGIDHATRAMQTMAQQGHATAGTLRELETGGVPALQAVAAYTGQSMAQVQASLSKGKISYQTVYNAITSFSGPLQQFQGLIQAHADTLSGLFSTLKDSIQTDLKNSFAPFVPEFTTVLQQMTPLVSQAVSVIGPAVAGLAGSIGSALGPAVQSIAGIVAPLFTGLGQAIKVLSPDIAPIGAALGSLSTALAPLIPLIAQLLGSLAQGLIPVVTQVAVALGPFISALTSALAPILPSLTTLLSDAGAALGGILLIAIRALTPLLGPLAQFLGLIAQVAEPLVGLVEILGEALGLALGNGIKALIPALTAVITAIQQVVTAFAPLIPMFVTALVPILPVIVNAFVQMVVPLLPLVQALANLLVTLAPLIILMTKVDAFFLSVAIKVFSAEVGILGKVLDVAVGVLTDIVQWVADLVGLFTGTNWDKIGGDIAGFFADVVGWFEKLPDEVLNGLKSLGSDIATLFRNAMTMAGQALSSAVNAIVGEFEALPMQLVHALADLGMLLLEAIKLAFQGLFEGIGILIGSLIFLFVKFPPMAVNALIAFGPMLLQWIEMAWNAMVAWLQSAWTQLVAFFEAIPGEVMNALSSFGALLLGWITSAWNGVYSTTVSVGGSVLRFFEAIPGEVIGFLSPLPGQVVGFFEQMWHDAESAVKTGISAVLGFISDLPGEVAGFGGKLLSAGSTLIQDLLKGLEDVGNFAGQLGTDIWNAFKGGINTAVGWINSGIHKIPGLGSVNIPFLASGGLVTQPTVAMIGDAGTEAVIPMSNADQALSVATSTGLMSLLSRASSGMAPGATGGNKIVNAPITIVTPAQDPATVASTVLANLVRVV